MKKIKVFYLYFVLFFAFCFWVIFFMPDTTIPYENFHANTSFNNDWHIETSSIHKDYDILPSFLHTNQEQDVYLTKKLQDIKEGDTLIFFSFQQQVSASIDGEEIYSFVPTAYTNSKTPGNRWNIIPLKTSYNGKTISIHIYECYQANRITLPDFHFGSTANIIIPYLYHKIPYLFLSMLMIFFAICIFVFYIIYRKKAELSTSLLLMSFFAFFRGAWTLIESNTYSLFFGRLLLISQISYMCLKLAAMSFLLFNNVTFHHGNNRVFNILIKLSFFDFILTFVLQMTGIADFSTTIFGTHLILLCSGLYILLDATFRLSQRHKRYMRDLRRKREHIHAAHIISIIIISTASLLDMFRYYYTASSDKAFFCRIGDLIYIFIIAFSLFIDFLYLVKTGQQAAIIKEEAYIDPMTKLKNRAAFEHDIDMIAEKNWKKYSFILLDLNNLKYCNDHHGHDMGDYYIIVSSEIIQDYFSSFGTVYRIGGDEFCVIAKHLNKENFLITQKMMENYMSSLRIPSIDLHMAISSGFASFDATLDKHIRDTMKRADEEMYNRKMEYKKNQS